MVGMVGIGSIGGIGGISGIAGSPGGDSPRVRHVRTFRNGFRSDNGGGHALL